MGRLISLVLLKLTETSPLLSLMTLLWFHTGNASGPDSRLTASQQLTDAEGRDAEVVRRAREEGCVNVVFPGVVTQNSCYHFVSEILKCVLYQRQQLPMTYDQLVYSQKKQQTSVQVWRSLERQLCEEIVFLETT